jgi:hypothetical protein
MERGNLRPHVDAAAVGDDKKASVADVCARQSRVGSPTHVESCQAQEEEHHKIIEVHPPAFASAFIFAKL